MKRIGMMLLPLCALACRQDKKAATETPESSPASEALAVVAMADASVPGALILPAQMAASTPDPEEIRVEGKFETPESVLYDAATDLYYVSNISGSPAEADGKGFISRLHPDGSIVELKWIDGLNAPKGMTVVADTLWVADIDRLRKFDTKTGKSRGTIEIKGASFLNDLTAGGGLVYVSDTGVNKSFEPVGTDAIYSIDGEGKVETLVKNVELHGPNGLTYADRLYMVNAAGELNIANKGGIRKLADLPTARLDGIESTGDKGFLISSWECSCIYAGPAKGPFVPVIDNVPSPADIGWDAKRKRVLVPLFNDNGVTIRGYKSP